MEGSHAKAPRNQCTGVVTRTVDTYNQEYDRQQ